MARIVLPIAGAVVGGFIGGPMGAQVGYALGAAAGNWIDPQTIKGPRLGEAGLQTSAEGVFRPVVYGTAAVQGNVINRGNHRIVRTTEGGKGGGPEVETEREYWTFAIRICEGPIIGVSRIWEDEKLVYDIRAESTIQAESAEYAERFTLYLGGEAQDPDPDLEAYMGAGNVNSYRGTAYIVFPNFDTTSRRSIPNFRFEVTTSAEQGTIGDVFIGPYIPVPLQDEPGPNMAVNAAGQPYIVTGYQNGWNSLVGVGEYYTVTRYDVQFNEISSTNITNQGLPIFPADQRIGVLCINQGSKAIVTGGNFGSLAVFNGGMYQAELRPDSGSPSDWFAGASEQQMEFDQTGYVWMTSSGIYVGVTRTGVSSPTVYNTIFRWAASPSGLTYSNASIEIEPESVSTGNVFLMNVSRASNVYVFNLIDNTLTKYDSNLANPVDMVVPAEVLGAVEDLYGIGVDEQLGIVCYAMLADTEHSVIITDLDGQTITDVFLEDVVNDSRIIRFLITDFGIHVQWGQRFYRIEYFRSLANEPVPLSSIVSALHTRAGMAATTRNVTALTDLVDGVVFAGDYTCADAIRTLAGTYFFDGPEYDAGAGYRVQYTKRGAAIDSVLTEDELLSIPDEQTRQDALERPRVLHLHFQSPTIGYAPAKASPQRFSPDVKVVGEASVQTPISFADQNEAWRRADVMLKVAHVEVAGTSQISVPWSYLDLVPSNAIGLTLRGQTRRYRIEQIFIGDGTLELTMMADRQSAWTSEITGVPLPDPTPPPPSIVGQAIGAFLDIPALNDTNDRLLYYVGMTGETEAWAAAIAQRSVDSAASWQEAARTPPVAVMGVLLNTVSPSSPHYPDNTNVVHVRLYRPGDELESLNDQQFLSEGGSFALSWMDGSDRKWEILQYRDANQVAEDEWELTTLLRGRLNTEGAEHLEGATFVLLDRVIAVDAITAWINQSMQHRYVSLGTSPELAPTSIDTYTGLSQMEFPVAHVFLDRIDPDTISVEVVPRHRFGTEDHPIRSQNWVSYRYAWTDGVNSSTTDSIERSLNLDVTGWASPVSVSVSQVNRITGAGPIVTEEIA